MYGPTPGTTGTGGDGAVGCAAMSVTIDDVRAASARIEGLVRRTPVFETRPVEASPAPGARLVLKLENLQVTGSFKARGAASKLTSLEPEALGRGIIAASGGNHGVAVAYTGRVAGVATTVYLPRRTPPGTGERLRRWGAEVVFEGEAWDDANAAALIRAEREGAAYFHPFADPTVIAGQGTLALELFEQVPDIDLMVVAIGGGGLISGVGTVAKALNPGLRLVGVEPEGAPTLARSLEAGRLVTLSELTTAALTLAPRRSAQINLDIVRRVVDEVVLVSDDEMREAAKWLWAECGLAVELSGAAAVAALMSGRVRAPKGACVAALLCGAGVAGLG